MWTLANFITSELVSNSNTGAFTVSYINSTAFLLYFVPFLFKGSYRHKHHHKHPTPETWFTSLGFIWPPTDEPADEQPRGRTFQTSWRARMGLPDPSSEVPTGEVRNAQRQALIRRSTASPTHTPTRNGAIDPEVVAAILAETNVPKAHLDPLTVRETSHVALWFAIQWFGANWAVNAALGMTNVASATTISSAQGLFTLVIGFLVGIEDLTLSKAVATLATLVGVALVANADTHAAQNVIETSTRFLPTQAMALLGDMTALASAFLYASYVIYLKRSVKEDSRLSMPFFFGWVGIWSIILFAPVGIVLHLTGIEPFVLPETLTAWMGMWVNMFITLTSDLFFMMAMLKSSPLAATVGISLTIPLAAFVEGIWGGKPQHWSQMIGDGLVVASFVTIGLAESSEVTADAVAAVHQEFLAEHERLESLAASLDLEIDPAAAIAALPKGTLRRMALSRSRSQSQQRSLAPRAPSRQPLPYPPSPSQHRSQDGQA